MFHYFWPIALVVVSNVMYQVCAKGVPSAIHPLASLTVTYLTGALISGILYFALNRDGSLLAEYRRLNWAPFVLGLVIVGLEVGYIYAYKAGWPVSTAATVQGAFLAVILVFVGIWLYRESVSWKTVAGILFCLIGLGFINSK